MKHENIHRVLNFGGGVQSTAMLVAACYGDLPDGVKPDVAIFADTQWEPPAVIAHVGVMTEWASQHGLEVVTVSRESIRTERGANQMPLHIVHADGTTGITGRQCTTDYKLDPIRKQIRKSLGYKPYQRWKHQLETWLGITTDEAQRMKPAKEKFETVRWPLIELGWNRESCKRYLERQDLPVPMKSSCIGCPYHSNRYFLDMKRERPEEWADVVAFDKQVRESFTFSKLDGKPYVHRSCKPLDEVYLQEDQIELFAEECSGYCES